MKWTPFRGTEDGVEPGLESIRCASPVQRLQSVYHLAYPTYNLADAMQELADCTAEYAEFQAHASRQAFSPRAHK